MTDDRWRSLLAEAAETDVVAAVVWPRQSAARSSGGGTRTPVRSPVSR